MSGPKVNKGITVTLENQAAWIELMDTFLALPDGFKPRAYMFTDANRTRQTKFRMVMDKQERVILVLGDSLPCHRGAKIFYEQGEINVFFNDVDLFALPDLKRLLKTVSASVGL